MADPDALPSVTLDGDLTLTVLSPTRNELLRLARNWHKALLDLNPRKAMLGSRPRPTPPGIPSTLDLEALVASQRMINRGAGVLNGIAYNPEADHLLVTGKRWSRVYALRLPRD